MFKSLLPWKHIKTKVMVPEQMMEDEEILEAQKLIPCTICGRTFLPLPLKKHVPTCEKNSTKRRAVFDSLKQRVEGTDLAQFHQKSYLKKQESTCKPVELKKPSQWEETHLKLVDTIRSAKGATNRKMSPIKKQPTTMSSSHERCPHCERQFGPKAFDRHVEWCKEHHRTRIQKSPANVLLAKERLEARTKYKVPPLNKSKKTTIREKYSSTNIVHKTESVCSVKSTPSNPKRKEFTVKKPKSVLDLGKRIDVLASPKVNEMVVSPAPLRDKKAAGEPNKSLRSKKYCPPREKVNKIHNENLESICVSPMKLVGFPGKKLVTWKDVTQKNLNKPDEESVIVVYENSNVFKKKDSVKNQNFIEELKQVLATEELSQNWSSSETLVSEDRKPFISPKSQSSPEIKNSMNENQRTDLFLVMNTRYSFCQLSKTSMNSECNSYEENSLRLSIDDDTLSYSNFDEPDILIKRSFPSCDADTLSPKIRECTDLDIIKIEGNELGKLSVSSVESEREENFDTCLHDLSEISSKDEVISNIDKEAHYHSFALNSAISSNVDFDSEHKQKLVIDSVEDTSRNSECDLILKTTEPRNNEETNSEDDVKVFSKNESSSHISIDSLFSENSVLDNVVSIQEPPSDVADLEAGVFKFGPMICVMDQETITDYDVPKKRRKLNSTFTVDEPVVCLNEVQTHRAEEVTTFNCENASDASQCCLLPKMSQQVEKTKEIKPPLVIKLPLLESKSTDQSGSVGLSVTRSKFRKNINMEKKNDLSDVYLSYQSDESSSYDPFISAEKQFMELFECDKDKLPTTTSESLITRPHTTAPKSVKSDEKKTVKSATTNKNRASVIDPPICFQDSESADDDFEMLENLLNDQFNNEKRDIFSSLNKQNKDDLNVILNQRKYSDSSSVDSSLINEHDNLTIPEHFKFANYSADSSEDTDITIQNDEFDLYSVQYDKKIEPQSYTKGNVRKNTLAKIKSNSSFGSGSASQSKKHTAKQLDGGKAKKEKSTSSVKTKEPENNKLLETTNVDLIIKPEDLFAVDDKMYAEYKIYEEMYLKEKEQMSNSKKHRTKNQIKSYGIELTNEDSASLSNKVSDDSAYGSLNRNSPKPRPAKLTSLQQRVDSASSSGSENLPITPCVNSQQRMSKFCHECGNKYPVATAKFCPECGVKRLLL